MVEGVQEELQGCQKTEKQAGFEQRIQNQVQEGIVNGVFDMLCPEKARKARLEAAPPEATAWVFALGQGLGGRAPRPSMCKGDGRDAPHLGFPGTDGRTGASVPPVERGWKPHLPMRGKNGF